MSEIIILKGLTKISLNKWYSSEHWIHRKRIKTDYTWLVKSQCKKVFKKDKQYNVECHFYFKTNPLDASNTIAMYKLIEDILFEDDKWDIIRSVRIVSNKDKDERVELIITEL